MKNQAMTEPNVKHAVPFFWVKNIEKSVRFYTDALGFTVVDKWVDSGTLRWCRLELGNAAVMLQEFWKEGRHANMPSEKVGVGVSICLQCRDALTIYREITGRGFEASRPFVGNRMWVTHVSDPDGYVLSFESPTDAAEESQYPEKT